MLPILFAVAAVAALFLPGCSDEAEAVTLSPDPARVPYSPEDQFHPPVETQPVTKVRIPFREWKNKRDALNFKIEMYYRQGEREFEIYAEREEPDSIVYLLNQKRQKYPDLKFRVIYFDPGKTPALAPSPRGPGPRRLVF